MGKPLTDEEIARIHHDVGRHKVVNDGDTTISLIVERLLDEIKRMKSHQFAIGVDGPEVTGQMLSDCGLNPFAFTLLSESFQKYTAKPKPFTVRHQGHIFHMRPIEDNEEKT